MPSPNTTPTTTTPSAPVAGVVAFLQEFTRRGALYAGHLRLLRAQLARFAAATTSPQLRERARRAVIASRGPALCTAHDELVAERTRFIAWAEGQADHVHGLGPVLDNLRRGGTWPPAPVPELPASLRSPRKGG